MNKDKDDLHDMRFELWLDKHPLADLAFEQIELAVLSETLSAVHSLDFDFEDLVSND